MAASIELGAEMSTPDVLRRAFTAGTGRVLWDGLARSLSFLLTVLLARALGAQGYGAFAVAWYAAWMLSQTTDLGLHLVTMRSLSRELRERTLASAVAAKGALTVIAAASALVVRWLQPETARLLGFLLGAQLVGGWVELSGIVLRSRGLIAREGVLLTTLRLGWLLAGVATFLAMPRDAGLDSLAPALFVSSLPALALALAMVARVGRVSLRAASISEALDLGRASLPLAATTVITLVYLRADLLLVAALRGAEEAGLFQSAFRLFEATFVVSGGIAAGTFPLLAARIGRAGFEGLSRFVLTLLVAIGLAIGFGFVSFSDRIVALVYGDGFRGAAPVLAFLGVALIAVFVNALTTHLLVASGRNRRLVTSMLVRLFVGVGLDLALVPSRGAAGAAIAVAAAEWSLLVASTLSAADLLGFRQSKHHLADPEGASSCS